MSGCFPGIKNCCNFIANLRIKNCCKFIANINKLEQEKGTAAKESPLPSSDFKNLLKIRRDLEKLINEPYNLKHRDQVLQNKNSIEAEIEQFIKEMKYVYKLVENICLIATNKQSIPFKLLRSILR